MIIYTMVSNPGGMLRVAESAHSIHSQLKDLTDIKIFIFSKRKFDGPHHPDIHYVEWDEYGNPYAKDQVEHYRELVKSIVPAKVDFLIGDYMSLAYFDFVEAEVIYDVHILGKPLYQAIKNHPGIHSLDQITSTPVTTLTDAQEFLFLKFENRFITRASRFIVNSQNSARFLRDLYTEEVKGKPMEYIPVASELSPPGEVPKKTMDVYYFGRFHPMKGFHFMFEQDWKEHPLFIRGLAPMVMDQKSRDKLKQQSITALPWSWESSSLATELLSSRLVLFPSIYEPWGLALQEALSLGCICLANRNNSGHEEQIQDGFNGFLVDMKSPGWHKRVGEILQMPQEKLNQISDNAKNQSKLGFKPRTDGFVNYVKKLLAQKV